VVHMYHWGSGGELMARVTEVALIPLSVGTRTVAPVQSSLPERERDAGSACSQGMRQPPEKTLLRLGRPPTLPVPRNTHLPSMQEITPLVTLSLVSL